MFWYGGKVVRVFCVFESLPDWKKRSLDSSDIFSTFNLKIRNEGKKQEKLYQNIEKPTSGQPTVGSWRPMSGLKWTLGAKLNGKEAERVTGPWGPVLTTWAITAIEQRCLGPHIWFVGQCVFALCAYVWSPLFPCHMCPQPADAL